MKPAEKQPAQTNGNGADHVVAEVIEGLTHKPFDPKKIAAGLHTRVDRGFLDYASYVIRDRAIPNLADGLKPVQRRILWALHEKDDGRFIKVANVVGHTMQYHPHGDASIGDALVVLANKRYLIEGQGNYGNIYTGDPAAAPRYIECRLTELARTEVFNDAITEFVPSYDGRN
ncbi:MAG TPA: DNA gyrase subunit A, partial [Verrucomicrobiae bacterium]